MPSLSQIVALVCSGWLASWPNQLFALIWMGWLISWVVASFWSGQTKKHVTIWDSSFYRIPIVVGALLLTPWIAQAIAAQPIWNIGKSGAYVLAGLIFVGLLLTWWARIYLGSLWSSAITYKADHQVIDTGPYAFVRHPIYSGLILALLATGITVATLPALLGSLLISFGLWQKARIEERFLNLQLGADTYNSYCRRVPMLIPFLPTSTRAPKRQ